MVSQRVRHNWVTNTFTFMASYKDPIYYLSPCLPSQLFEKHFGKSKFFHFPFCICMFSSYCFTDDLFILAAVIPKHQKAHVYAFISPGTPQSNCFYGIWIHPSHTDEFLWEFSQGENVSAFSCNFILEWFAAWEQSLKRKEESYPSMVWLK